MMMDTAINTIKETAQPLGITRVDYAYKKQKIGTIMSGLPRIGITVLPETIKEKKRKISRIVDEEQSHVTIRHKTHEVGLNLRLAVLAESQDFVETFVRNFIVDMPSRITDTNNNTVAVTVQKAERQGYEKKIVKVRPVVEIGLYLTFTYILFWDQVMPMIGEVKLHAEMGE